MPGERWVSGPESRRLVHELRAQVDAVAVGGGTARADRPRLDARDVDTPRGQPRRLVFSSREVPGDLERRAGSIEDELRSLADEGVQSLLLEGGPTLAAAFLAAGLVDKLMLFVAPALSGEGPAAIAALPSPRTLTRLTARQLGADVLLEAYVHEP
jgi:diaminohydroxyphosphoribosylaminopyrimidine deaminase/5-amino-6-(5-phosphoribosylamino)uracil reductase